MYYQSGARCLYVPAPTVKSINLTAGSGNDKQTIAFWVRFVDVRAGGTTDWILGGAAIANDNSPAAFSQPARAYGYAFALKSPNLPVSGVFKTQYLIGWYPAKTTSTTLAIGGRQDAPIATQGWINASYPSAIAWGGVSGC